MNHILFLDCFVISKMPVMRSSKSTGERVNVAAHEGISYPPTSDVVQSGDQDESISQTSPTPPSPKELRREMNLRTPLSMLPSKI